MGTERATSVISSVNRPRLLFGVAAALVGILWIYMAPNYYVFIGTSALILAIAAMGLTVLVGWAGEVSLAQAGLTGTVVFLAAYAVRSDGWGWPYMLGVLWGLAVGIAFSLGVALPTAKLSGMYVMVLTLSLQVALERIFFGNATLTGGGEIKQVERPELFGLSLEGDKAFYFFCLAVTAGVILWLNSFRKSRHDRAMMLVRTDRRAAAAMGISPYRYKLMGFVIAGCMASVAGLLLIPLYRTPPTLYQFQAFASLYFLAIPVVAGFESLVAVVAVSFAFSIIPVALESLNLSPYIIAGIALILGTAAIGSRGIAGAILDLVSSKKVNRALEDYAVEVDRRVLSGAALAEATAPSLDLTGGGPLAAAAKPEGHEELASGRDGSR